jgi:hypothetical protein
MDEVTTYKLAQADRQIVEGIGLIMKQRDLISEMERSGVDTRESEAALARFLKTLRQFVDYRDRLLREKGA